MSRSQWCCLILVMGLMSSGRPASAQRGHEGGPEPYSVADILSAPFASSLIAAPDGRAVAWIGYERGARNVWLAEAPGWRARRLTRWMADEGQPLSGLVWTADSRALLVVRGGEPGGNWSQTEPVNPTSDPGGSEQAVWLVTRAGATRRIGEGHSPAPNPRGDRLVYVLRDTLRVAPLRTAGAPQILLRMRGQAARPVWSPDGRRLTFVSRRGDHSFVGVFDPGRRTLRWIAPSSSRDDLPRWSPGGDRLAFVRRSGATYGTGLPLPPAAAGAGTPAYAIHVAYPDSATSREVWRSPMNADGGFPGLAGEWALQWARGESDLEVLVFASEQSGWLGLYALAPDVPGDTARRLTPSGCELQDVVASADRRAFFFASNCGDIDRRHVQSVTAGGSLATLTAGGGIEWSPAPLADGSVAVLRATWQLPAAPALVRAQEIEPLGGWTLPEAFPREQLVEPLGVVVRAADSTAVHLQVFLPLDGGRERRPAVLFFHGGPTRQMLLGWHHRGYYHNSYALNQYLASRGFVVVSVNYRGGDGYGRAFRDAPRRGRFGASEYQDVLAATAWLRGRADVDSTRIGLWGGSYGGYLTALGLARNSDLFAAGVDLHGVHDYADAIGATRSWDVSDSAIALFRRNSPVADVERWRSPVLLVHGDDDRNVQFQQTTDLVVRLRRRGVQVEELIFPDDAHGFLLHRNWVAAYGAAGEFFARTLRERGERGATGAR